MDFSCSEEQQAVADLARRVLESTVTPDRLRELRARGEHLDLPAWRELARAGLVGIAVPEAYGGAEQGFVAATLVLEQIGRTVAPVPFYASAICGAMPIAEFGTREQQRATLPAAVRGELILSGAYAEIGTTPYDPATRATRDGDHWVLTGQKDFVPAGLDADRIVVSARVDDGAGLFLVDPTAPGVTVTRQDVANEIPEARLELSGAPAELLTLGRDALRWTIERAVTGLCAIGVGVFDEEVRMTAEYTSTRRQFGKPIGSFQAVGQRAADAYIDTEAIRLTTRQAAWRLEHALPASVEVAAAKFWLAEGGQRVAAAAEHLHGGIGVDRAYPLHRYYLWAKWLQVSLGGAHQHLLGLGAILAKLPRLTFGAAPAPTRITLSASATRGVQMRWSHALAAAALATAGVALSAPAGAAAQSQTFTTDGTFTVPATVCAVTFTARGGHGGTVSAIGLKPGAGGAGSIMGGFIDVFPGEVLHVVIGHAGGDGSVTDVAPWVAAGGTGGTGYRNGGNGGSGYETQQQIAGGGGGGGASAISNDSEALVIVGGGGGGAPGRGLDSTRGGDGGAADSSGGDGAGSSPGLGGGDGPSGGAGGTAGVAGVAGQPQSAGNGGAGGGADGTSQAITDRAGGGGGGGFRGGGGGGSTSSFQSGAGGGGGGMSAVGSPTHLQQFTSGGSGDGVVTLTWNPGPCAFGSLPPGSTDGTATSLAPATPVAAAITFTG